MALRQYICEDFAILKSIVKRIGIFVAFLYKEDSQNPILKSFLNVRLKWAKPFTLLPIKKPVESLKDKSGNLNPNLSLGQYLSSGVNAFQRVYFASTQI